MPEMPERIAVSTGTPGWWRPADPADPAFAGEVEYVRADAVVDALDEIRVKARERESAGGWISAAWVTMAAERALRRAKGR